MKLITLDGTPFANALRDLLGTLVGKHPESETILDAINSGRIDVRVVIDQPANLMTVGATLDHEGIQRVIATVDMAAGSRSWQVVYPEWTALPQDADPAG